MAKPTILQDTRYVGFVERYHNDLLRFMVEVCGMEPSQDQINLALAMCERDDARVSVVSGTGTGKTMCFGRIALWHLLCFPFSPRLGQDSPPVIGSNTYIGAPRIQQVAKGVWKEMNDAKIAIMNGPHAWIADYFTIGKTEVYIHGYAEQWFISQVAMQQGQSVGVAGKHRYWQLIIIDEAAGVPDDHFNVITGTQTEGGNRTLLASQGVRNAGYFRDTHHKLSKKNGGDWEALRFSSERSPFVTTKWLKDRELECGGRDSVEYKIRVLGLFAADTSNLLLSDDDIEMVLKPRSIIRPDEPYGIVLLADVGLGEYRDDSVLTVMKVVGHGDFGDDAMRVEVIEIPLCTNSRDEINFAGDVVSIFGRMDNPTLAVDNGGVGATVIKLIERSGVPVTRINWGAPCFRKEYKDRYYNQRACGMVRLRDAIRQGRFAFPNGVSQELANKIKDQGSRLPYHFVEAGGLKYKMMSKEDMRKEGISSPDIMDTFAFAFLEGVTYIPQSGGGEKEVIKRLEAALSNADEELARLGL